METPQSHFNKIAHHYDAYKQKNSFYYSHLKRLLISLVPSARAVLEIGCGTGELLAAVNPALGLGIDISTEMISLAKKKYRSNPRLDFKVSSAETLSINGKWDYVIMVDVIEHLENPQAVFKRISRCMSPHTKLIITMANPIWEPVLLLAEKLHLKMPEGPHHRINFKETNNYLSQANLVVIKHDFDLTIPIFLPVITSIINRLKSKQLRRYGFIEYIVAAKENHPPASVN